MNRERSCGSRALLGQAVETESARHPGTLVDVLLDADTARAVALLVRNNRNHEEYLVPYAGIPALRPSTLFLARDVHRQHSGILPREAHAGGRVRVTRLRNRRVITHRGADIGAIDEVYLDAEGRITAYDVVNVACGSALRLRGRLKHSPRVRLGDTLTLSEGADDETGTMMHVDEDRRRSDG